MSIARGGAPGTRAPRFPRSAAGVQPRRWPGIGFDARRHQHRARRRARHQGATVPTQRGWRPTSTMTRNRVRRTAAWASRAAARPAPRHHGSHAARRRATPRMRRGAA